MSRIPEIWCESTSEATFRTALSGGTEASDRLSELPSDRG